MYVSAFYCGKSTWRHLFYPKFRQLEDNYKKYAALITKSPKLQIQKDWDYWTNALVSLKWMRLPIFDAVLLLVWMQPQSLCISFMGQLSSYGFQWLHIVHLFVPHISSVCQGLTHTRQSFWVCPLPTDHRKYSTVVTLLASKMLCLCMYC